MYDIIQNLHSIWAYLVLLLLVMASANSWMGLSSKKDFATKDFRIALFTLIVSHIQLLIGLVAYFMSPYFASISDIGMGSVMKDSTLRLYVVEHPSVMIIAIVLITMGFSKHKKKETAPEKFKTLALFYSIALVLVLSRLPWSAWLA